jgi:hypothetical protein
LDYDRMRRKFDLEEQLDRPWDFAYLHYGHLDSWKINNNRISRDKYLLEVAKELGSTTVPHWER